MIDGEDKQAGKQRTQTSAIQSADSYVGCMNDSGLRLGRSLDSPHEAKVTNDAPLKPLTVISMGVPMPRSIPELDRQHVALNEALQTRNRPASMLLLLLINGLIRNSPALQDDCDQYSLFLGIMQDVTLVGDVHSQQ